MNTGEKILEIRKLMKLSRKEMEIILGFPNRTLERIEKQENNISFDYIQALLNEFPEFIYWIILDKTEVEIGQINTDLYSLYNLHFQIMRNGYLSTGNESFNEKYEDFNWKNEEHINIIIKEDKRLSEEHESLKQMEEKELESHKTDNKNFLNEWNEKRNHIHK